jgi:excisionase family DNA binding protein
VPYHLRSGFRGLTPQLLTVAEVARQLGESSRQVRARIAAGELPAVALPAPGGDVTAQTRWRARGSEPGEAAVRVTLDSPQIAR